MRTFAIVIAAIAAPIVATTLVLISSRAEQRAAIALNIALVNQASGPCHGSTLAEKLRQMEILLSLSDPPLTLEEIRAGAIRSEQVRLALGEERWCSAYTDTLR